jgi:GNAT superfamily N-acetyltransferase
MTAASPGEPYSGLPEPYFKAIEQSVSNPAPFVHHLLGSFGSIPVATATVCVGPSYAGIYNVAVLPEFRRRGFGAAISHACVKEAYTQDNKTVVFLQTEAGSTNETFYKNLGFQSAFTAHCFAPVL